MRADAWIRAGLASLLLSAGAPGPGHAAEPANGAPPNAAGIVLPGFGGVHVDGQRIALSAGRAYLWNAGVLPTRIESRGTALLGPMTLTIRDGDASRQLNATAVRVTASAPDHADLLVTGEAGADLGVEARIHIEYDGMAIVDLTIMPRGHVHIGTLELAAPITRTRDTRLLGFDPQTIYQYNKQILFPLCADLPYKSVLGFTDTRRSFWLLTDEPAIPTGSQHWPTRLACNGTRVQLRQPLLKDVDLGAPLTLRFAFLATPVRDLPPAYRKDRVVTGLTADDARLGNRQLWWIEALAHNTLAYTDYPPGVRERLGAAEIAAYPGLAANRRAAEAWRRLGIERLPYVSLRAPSGLDDVVARNAAAWRVLPSMDTAAQGDGPYQQGIARPILSLRAQDFADYWLHRLDQITADLPVRGFYFDQAEPVGSANPVQLPADPRVRPAMATDILAMREFFKRLATSIHAGGQAPLIYVHNSTAPVVPAYTFATAMVQGEEFNLQLRNFDYLGSTDLDFLQATYANGASAVPVIWLEEVWSDYLAEQRPPPYRSDLGAWLRSPEYFAGLRNFMSLALLHDIPAWSMAPASVLHKLYDPLDRFGIDQSTFTGYWERDADWRSRVILVSTYRRDDGHTLAVIVNRGDAPRVLSAQDLAPFLNRGAPAPRQPGSAPPAEPVGLTVGAKDYLLTPWIDQAP